MSEQFNSGVHLDPDTLSAFVEGVLPEHERTQCLAHLAACDRCREVVFLAQDDVPVAAAPAVVSMPRPIRRRWLGLAAAAAAVVSALLGTWLLFLRSPTDGAPSHELAAQVTPPAPIQTPETPAPLKPAIRRSVPMIRRPQLAKPIEAPAPPPFPPAIVTMPDSNSNFVILGSADRPVPAAPKPPVVEIQIASGVSGTVADATGAVVPNAAVQLRSLAAGGSTASARTDQAGQFKFSGLDAGQYELQVNAPGFRKSSLRIEVQPQEVVSVKAELQIGSVSESVEVAAADSTTIQTDSSSMSVAVRSKAAPRPLPDKLPVELMVREGKVILAIDSAGALFYSGNYGKSWKRVKPKWSGKVDELVAPPDVPNAGKAKFQLTTDADTTWLSRDGRHWHQVPPQN